MATPIDKVPGKAWVVTFAGTAINLCLGILYAWSVWGAALTVPKLPDGKFNESRRQTMKASTRGGPTSAMLKWRLPSLCAFHVCPVMIHGGRILDKYGPKAAPRWADFSWRPDASCRSNEKL